MFTKWDQIESWIRDNNFAHWIITRNKPEEESKKNDILVDSNYYTGDEADKIAMTKKYLLLNGGRGYGVGFRTPNSTVGGVVCEIRLDETDGAPIGAVQQNIQPLNIGEIEQQVYARLKAQMEADELKKRIAEVERREKELDEDRQSALGAIVHYFAPIGKMLIENKLMRNVAGVDTDAPITVQPMHVAKQEPENIQEDPEEQPPFTDEEADEAFDLMRRFKAVEPENWLKMLRTVVTMAESGDATYTMAKGFLIK